MACVWYFIPSSITCTSYSHLNLNTLKFKSKVIDFLFFFIRCRIVTFFLFLSNLWDNNLLLSLVQRVFSVLVPCFIWKKFFRPTWLACSEVLDEVGMSDHEQSNSWCMESFHSWNFYQFVTGFWINNNTAIETRRTFMSDVHSIETITTFWYL